MTVQGAISAASAVATAACQAKEFPLPQTMLLQCPASVRKQVRPSAVGSDPRPPLLEGRCQPPASAAPLCGAAVYGDPAERV